MDDTVTGFCDFTETEQRRIVRAGVRQLSTKLTPDQPPETATLDDAQAKAMPADDRIAVTVRLKPRHYEYLTLRAQMNGRETAQELEAILRDFKAYHDPMRPDQAFAEPIEPGMPAMARRQR